MMLEIQLDRFRDIVLLVRHMKATGAFFTTDGIVFIESPSGDYLFLKDTVKTDVALAIGQAELKRIGHLLKLDRERPKDLERETIRIEPHQMTTLPYQTVYQRTTRLQALEQETASRLDALARFPAKPTFRLIPARHSNKRDVGRGVNVTLQLGPAVVWSAGRITRIAGFSKESARLSFHTPTARLLLAYVERRAALAKDFINGMVAPYHSVLFTEGVYARIQSNRNED